MNRILISLLGVIVVSVCLYYITSSNDSSEEASLNESELTQDEELEELNDEEGIEEVETASAEPVTEEENLQQVAYLPGQENTVKAIIAKQHQYLNELAGWGNAESIQIAQLKNDQKWQKLQEDLEWLQEEGFADSIVMHDLENASEFISIVHHTGDSMSIRYLHRIFHDLDANMNKQKVDQIWNVTHAFGTEGEQNQLYAYLNNSQTE
jgi:hypothetical protein